MNTTLIKNATVALPGELANTNILIKDGTIVDVDAPVQSVAEHVVDAEGKFLLPGMVDDQVHFREPGLTTKEDLAHASTACAKGGITSFLEMPNTIPNATTEALVIKKLEIASTRSLVNFGFYIGATTENIEDLKTATRTPGIKIFIGSSTGDLLVDDEDALQRIFRETTLPICAHCEDETTVRANAAKYASSTDVATHSKIRDHAAALIATKRAIGLATKYEHPFHVLHVSTAAEIDVIAAAPDYVTAEACPHHLFFNVDDYPRLGSLIKMNPSIKNHDDNLALWQALRDGIIEVIATDHAPHTIEEKQLPYPDCPSGLPAVENSLALMLNEVNLGHCDLLEVVGWMSSAPARIWNMKNKGTIEVGADADLVLVDMDLVQTIRNEEQLTKCKWSPWDGVKLRGWPTATWVHGHQVSEFRDGAYHFDKTQMGREINYERQTDG